MLLATTWGSLQAWKSHIQEQLHSLEHELFILLRADGYFCSKLDFVRLPQGIA